MIYGIIIVAIAILIIFYVRSKRDKNILLRFIERHPEQSSVQIIHNGEIIFEVHPDRPMPLASTVKIIVAIEYAKQAGSGRIQPDMIVKLSELDRFYLPNLDGGAHPNWIEFLRNNGRLTGDSVKLEEVAKGMIRFSSNANTEYLMELLGLDNINRNLEELGLSRHEPLYPFVSSILLPYELMKEYPLDLPHRAAVSQAKAALKAMPPDEFRERAYQIHRRLRADTDGSYKQSANLHTWYDADWDKMNSERFIASTAREYVSIMRQINAGSFLEPAAQTHLKTVLEGLMEHPANQQWLVQAGKKGGSTAYILTEAIYAADKQGNTTEAAIFFYRLTPRDVAKLSAQLNQFELKLLTDPSFRNQLQSRRVPS